MSDQNLSVMIVNNWLENATIDLKVIPNGDNLRKFQVSHTGILSSTSPSYDLNFSKDDDIEWHVTVSEADGQSYQGVLDCNPQRSTLIALMVSQPRERAYLYTAGNVTRTGLDKIDG